MHFSYLNFENHPRGNSMFQALLANNFYPNLVIEECSEEAEQGKLEYLEYLEEFSSNHVELSVREICEFHRIPYEKVSNHNNDRTVALLSERKSNYVVLGDTRILRKPVIETACDGIINVHPGFLPIVRGNNPYIWALALGLPQGASVHFVELGVDTGPIILKQELKLENILSFGHLICELNKLCAELLPRALIGLGSKTVNAENQTCKLNPTFRKAPKEFVEYSRSLLQKVLSNKRERVRKTPQSVDLRPQADTTLPRQRGD